MSQNIVSDKDTSLVTISGTTDSIDGQLLQNGIVGGSDRIKFLRCHAFESHWLTGGDLIVNIVVLVQETTPQHVLWRGNGVFHGFLRLFRIGADGSGQIFGDFSEIEFLHLDPIRLDGHRGLAINTVVVVTSSSPSPSSASSAASTSTSATSGTSTSSSTVFLLRESGKGSAALLLSSGINLSQSSRVLSALGCRGNKSLDSCCLTSINQLECFVLDITIVFIVFVLTVVVAIILIVAALSVESASISTAQVCKIGSSSQTITSSKRRVRQVQKLSRAGRGVWIAFVRTWAWRPPRIGIRCHEGN
mmetsp:Transcript_11434/g.28897  ORF Transcript_11434/g.28897 Transcript_11434/m.28897 type:complete len:305 (-) Transcript_11434:106-1020(-)